MSKPPSGAASRFANRAATLRALVLLCFMRGGMRLGGYRRMKVLQTRLARVRDSRASRPTVPRAMLSIERAKRYLPGKDTCLPDAFVGQILLARAGYASDVKYGVEPGPGGRSIRAHAWLVCEGHVVLGAAEAGRYVSLEAPPGP